ncbi:MAG: succinate dehydrogenase/fumarate reductase flavoprotein subunit [Anaerolineae bacterium]|nr:succinate dehydrogenase/fumarate reductase flavoprotein subunit [Anaerolineae bacterium]
MEVYNHDLIILGTGLAGLRAALEAAKQSKGELDIALVSKLQLMRAHSVAAEGGTAAVMRQDMGDSYELHAWDTVKGSDFLADQNVVDFFVHEMPKEILHLDHWGIPWSRTEDGHIAQRPFGGHTYPRAVFAADKTGHLEMQTLYDTLMKHTKKINRYDEGFVTSILIENNRFAGLAMIDMINGKFVLIRGKALILATGGAGQIFGFTTYSETVTGDGLAMAYRAGLTLKDMEFIQFHPTGLIPSGILMTEACRGEGGTLLNNKDERFMGAYAPSKMELAPRDMVSRSEMTEIEAGRGFPGPEGLDYIHLDLRHLGRKQILERLPLIREVTIKHIGLDPIEKPIPIRPVAHYTMGGVHTDIKGHTPVENIWAAGEVSCVSLHGANRLGANSTAECLVWGRVAGEEAARYCANASMPEMPKTAEQEWGKIEALIASTGTEDHYQIRKELRKNLDATMGVFRTGEQMEAGLKKIRELKERYKRISLKDKSLRYNTDLERAIETGFMIDVAEVATLGALTRTESRGGHARRDFKVRDDDNWLKHTMADYSEAGPKLSYSKVDISMWKPVERKY